MLLGAVLVCVLLNFGGEGGGAEVPFKHQFQDMYFACT